MRTIGRILVILLAAVAVAGATAILVDNRLLGAQGPGEWGEGLETAEFEGRQRPEGDFDHGERGEHEGGRDGQAGSLLAGLIRNLGIVALITRQELVLVLVGGVFVVEALSVIGQVASFKLRRKRIFKMAPIHHHFEALGWQEPKIITRFWIAGLVMALFALTTLKLR